MLLVADPQSIGAGLESEDDGLAERGCSTWERDNGPVVPDFQDDVGARGLGVGRGAKLHQSAGLRSQRRGKGKAGGHVHNKAAACRKELTELDEKQNKGLSTLCARTEVGSERSYLQTEKLETVKCAHTKHSYLEYPDAATSASR